jgi:DNA-binding HxlR family transcriptional regulator
MSIPQPGKKVRGSDTGAPLMAIFDLLGRRWAMGIIWNLDDGPLTFRALQKKCGMISPSILNNRIKDLKEAGILIRTLEGYDLTELGAELRKTLIPMGEWSDIWAEKIFNYKSEE